MNSPCQIYGRYMCDDHDDDLRETRCDNKGGQQLMEVKDTSNIFYLFYFISSVYAVTESRLGMWLGQCHLPRSIHNTYFLLGCSIILDVTAVFSFSDIVRILRYFRKGLRRSNNLRIFFFGF